MKSNVLQILQIKAIILFKPSLKKCTIKIDPSNKKKRNPSNLIPLVANVSTDLRLNLSSYITRTNMSQIALADYRFVGYTRLSKFPEYHHPNK